jgi:hypothetical protein
MADNMAESIKDLKRIPGVGKSIAEDLYILGYRSVKELAGENPLKMYDSFNNLTGKIQDRCLLYVFRCAVYFATEKVHDPELLKWWNWKNLEYNGKSITPRN